MPADMMRFDDDVAIVTGAGRGLGREHALLFAARGARVAVNDIDLAAAEEVARDIEAAGGKALADTHDVSTRAGAEALVAAAMEGLGPVTVLVNNAGVIDFGLFEDLSDEAWTRMHAVTLDGAFYMSRAVWPHFLRAGYGRIVNTTSNAGFAGSAQLVHYGAAKMGVAGLTKALAQEAEAHGVTVNAIAPMAVTRMNRDVFFGGQASEGEDWREDIRSGRVPMGPPSAVSPTVLWLAHRTTTVNGDVYSTSSGKVARVGFVVGEGYFDPNHTPEMLRDHIDQLRSLDGCLDPRSTMDELAVIPPLFGVSDKGN